jgi:hypothetical protein
MPSFCRLGFFLDNGVFGIMVLRNMVLHYSFSPLFHLVAMLTKFTIGRGKLHHVKHRFSKKRGVVFLDPESAQCVILVWIKQMVDTTRSTNGIP